MIGTNVSLSRQVLQHVAPQDLPIDLLSYISDLSEPENEHYATFAKQTFSGVNGEVDHFIFDTDIDRGSYEVKNYEPGSDWLVFISDQGESVEITAIYSDVTYTSSTDSTSGHVHVNPSGEASGISVANLSRSASSSDASILI